MLTRIILWCVVVNQGVLPLLCLLVVATCKKGVRITAGRALYCLFSVMFGCSALVALLQS